MRVMYVTNKPVYPKIDGGCVATASFLNNLISAGYEVLHLTISTDKHPFNLKEYPNSVADKIHIDSKYINTKVKVSDAVKHLFSNKSYNVERFNCPEFKKLILSHIHEVDTIILDSLYTTTVIDDLKKQFKGKVYLRIHNIEAEIWEDLSKNETNSIKKKYLSKLSKDLRKYEHDVYQKLDGIMALSPDDMDYITSHNLNNNAILIPVNVEVFESCEDHSGNNIFHLGSMNWQPNIEAVDELINIYNQFKSEFNGSTLHIAGKHAEDLYKTDESKGIYVDGFVDDLQKYSCKTGIMCSPINSGSGIRIKILEMMGMGIPVVTTPTGAKGLYPEAHEAIIIADSKEALKNELVDLIHNKDRREMLGNHARAYISKYHNQQTVNQKLVEFLS